MASSTIGAKGWLDLCHPTTGDDFERNENADGASGLGPVLATNCRQANGRNWQQLGQGLVSGLPARFDPSRTFCATPRSPHHHTPCR